MRQLVLEKREPATAPITITAPPPSHHGSTACTQPVPCRMAEPAIAPNNSPPGNFIQRSNSASAVDTTTRTTSSTSDEPPAGSGAPITAPAASPNSARLPGSPIMISSTRITCTIATPRRSALNSAESATTCAIAPGDAPKKAEAQSQPWTKRR